MAHAQATIPTGEGINHSTASRLSKRASRTAPTSPTDAATGILLHIAFAILSCIIFFFVALAMLSTHANASLFKNDRKSEPHADEDEDAQSDGPLAFTQEAMQRLMEHFDEDVLSAHHEDDAIEDGSTTHGSPALGAPTPSLASASSPCSSSATIGHAWPEWSWDWVREGQDELEDEEPLPLDPASVHAAASTASSTMTRMYLSQTALMALDAEMVEHSIHPALRPHPLGSSRSAALHALDNKLGATPSSSPDSSSHDSACLGLGIFSAPLTPPTTPEPTNSGHTGKNSSRPGTLVRQSTTFVPPLRQRPSCSSLTCECDIGERRLCTLSEVDDEEDASREEEGEEEEEDYGTTVTTITSTETSLMPPRSSGALQCGDAGSKIDSTATANAASTSTSTVETTPMAQDVKATKQLNRSSAIRRLLRPGRP
ncbi:hypothetical protein OC844_000166 [Tilletia horrida]|nr:hypothetical protein OC844_000166 [Tilletia horrida]